MVLQLDSLSGSLRIISVFQFYWIWHMLAHTVSFSRRASPRCPGLFRFYFLHFRILSFVKRANVCCITGDNLSTNKRISDISRTPLIGCASHRFYLAVQSILSEEEELLSHIARIMNKLKCLLLSANYVNNYNRTKSA